MVAQTRKRQPKQPSPSILEGVGRVASLMRLDTVKMARGAFAIVEDSPQKRERPLLVAVDCHLNEKSVLAEVHLDFLDSPAFLPGVSVSISASFRAMYSFDGEAIVKEDLLAFGRVNGLFNAWPYWREFAQSATQRLELPGLVFPLLTAQQAAAWATECKEL